MLDLFGPASFDGAVTVRPADNRSFGTSDTWFRDCSDPTLDDGTEFGAAFFNAWLANARSLARANGQTGAGVDIVTQDNADDSILLKAIQQLFQRQQPITADDISTSGDLVTITLTPTPAELKRGMSVRVKIANNGNAGANLSCNGTVKAIKAVDGTAIGSGALLAGQMANFDYDGTAWQLVSVSAGVAISLPRASINLASISSYPFGTWTNFATSLLSSSSLAPVISGSSFTLPAGTYLIGAYGSTRINNVNAQTQVALGMRITQNGVMIAQDMEETQLLAGQDVTSYQNMGAVFVTAAPSDVFAVSAWAGTTFGSDFTGANANAGRLNVMRIGN